MMMTDTAQDVICSKCAKPSVEEMLNLLHCRLCGTTFDQVMTCQNCGCSLSVTQIQALDMPNLENCILCRSTKKGEQ